MSIDKLKQAMQLHQQQEFAAAEKIYREILEDDTTNRDALHGLAMLLTQTENYSAALNLFEQAVELEQNDPALFNSYGNLLLRMKQFEEAEQAYKNSITLAPKYANAYSNLGNCYLQQDNYTDAEKNYRIALELNPNSRHVQFNLATALAKQNKTNPAIELLQQLTTNAPEYAAAWEQLGQLYFKAEQYKQALDAYQHQVQLQPGVAEAWHYVGVIQQKLQNYPAAIAALLECIKFEKKHPEAYFNLGTCYLKQAEIKKALKYYLQQLEFNQDIECYFNIGVIKMNQDQHKDAISYFEKCLNINPNYLPAHQNLAAIYLKIGHTEAAIKHYRFLLQQDPDNAEIKHILTALEQQETPEQAPNSYISNLFNSYAEHYEQHLTEYLHYDVPQQIAKAIAESNIALPQNCKILDLGCGTGLAAEEFKQYKPEIIGVDLAEKMLDVAKQRNIYQDLICADINTAITEFKDQDLIIAADVLSYFGNLEDICEKVATALTSQGYFAFSVEKGNTYPYKLDTTIRYQHSEQYLKEVLADKFNIVHYANSKLRKQHQGHIEGYIVIAQSRN